MSDTSQLRPKVPQMTISMLGATRSGKSSYLAGMYNDIVRGAYSYTFKADNEIRLRVSAEISELRDGKLPEATDETSPKVHKYTLGAVRGDKFIVLVEIDLTDFRGGAILNLGTEGSDSAKLFELLPKSDSIFVVLDGTHFAEPVTQERYEKVAAATDANDIANLIGGVLVDRRQAARPMPSVAVLLAKSDLIYGPRQPGGPSRREAGDVRQDVSELLPVAFELGRKSGFFEVSIGEFYLEDGKNRLASIQPNGVAGPIFFSVACFLTDHQQVLEQERQVVEAALRKAEDRLASLQSWPEFIRRLFLQNKIAKVQAERDGLRRQSDAYRERAHEVAEELGRLWQWLQPTLWSGRPR